MKWERLSPAMEVNTRYVGNGGWCIYGSELKSNNSHIIMCLFSGDEESGNPESGNPE